MEKKDLNAIQRDTGVAAALMAFIGREGGQ